MAKRRKLRLRLPRLKRRRKTTKQTAAKKKTGRQVNKLNLWTLILMFVVFCELVAFCVGGIALKVMLRDRPQLVISDFFSPESSHIYDKDGNLIADVGTQIRENVTYDELSEALIDAFLAVEDSRYFGHNGFDLPRFTKSTFVTLKNVLLHNPEREGGSTFTMQLVKLTYFQNDETGYTHQKDIEYKIQQIALAIELEKQSNKEAIFELYLNKMNFGGTGNIRGIEKAAQYYYGKSASQLNLAESAMLAGVINSPYWFDPHNFLDYATNRRNTVLYLLKRHGYITDREYRLARSINVEDTLINPASTSTGRSYAYQSYIDTAISEAEALTGMDPLTTAMEIYTYMDPAAQSVMDAIQRGEVEAVQFPDDLMECAMISENNQTGEIVAIGGGRNYGRGGSMLLNHATQQYKQPGSSVKPIIDYALAFEYLGWATSHVVTDRPITYQGTNIIIKNASGQYGGEMTLQYAVSMSLNTPAIQTLTEVINTAGWQRVVDYIKSLGFSKVSEDNFDIGFAIGGSNFTCSPLELMAAHAVLMNGGYYIQPHTISKIVFRSGYQEPLVPTYEPVSVLSPQAAYLAAELMRNVVPQYVYTQMLQRNYPVYAKTGTTDWGSDGLDYNIPQGASKDKWMISETGQYTTAVWVGYEKGVKDAGTYFDNYKSNLNLTGRISNELLSVLNDNLVPQGVQRPAGISDITHILGTFPYAYPIDGMDWSYITSGMIKSEYANLVSPESADSVASLTDFAAEYTFDGKIHVWWPTYPEPEKLQTAEDTMDISLYDGAGNCLVSAWGKRLFDYSWIFGPIRYKVRISQNGLTIAEKSVDYEEQYFDDLELLPGTETEACGFYAYENGGGSSNEMCVHFYTPEEEAEQNPDQDAEQKCWDNGGTWADGYCSYPAAECIENGGEWTVTGCVWPQPEVQNVEFPPMTATGSEVQSWADSHGISLYCEHLTRERCREAYPYVQDNEHNIMFDRDHDDQLLNGRIAPANTNIGCWVIIDE